GRILVMDDEESILAIAEKMLAKLGYDVVTARNGEQAVEIYKQAMQSDKKIDAVILDLTIVGGMSGKDTIGQLLKIDTNVKAIVSSGYSTDIVVSEYDKYGFKGILPKPYELVAMSQVLNKILVKCS
ncbi:MAG: response regulator, partial [Elusimicrobiota bacterium]